jgi:hypothetical protein
VTKVMLYPKKLLKKIWAMEENNGSPPFLFQGYSLLQLLGITMMPGCLPDADSAGETIMKKIRKKGLCS